VNLEGASQMNDEIALKIGRHILEHYAKWTENPCGRVIAIPVKLPHVGGEPDWIMTVTCEMPAFIEQYWEDGVPKFKHWSMKEWYESKGKLK
jgi:hypothetical protein